MKPINNILIFVSSMCISLTATTKQYTTANAVPKNVIVMISDGCGYYHIDAASIYQFGRPDGAVYERFPVKYAMSTYSASGAKYDPDNVWQKFNSVEEKPTDSAAAATAMAGGVKACNGAIGIDPDKVPVENVVERLEKLRKSTGVITSVQFAHATPAAFVAHNESRKHYEVIARDMLTSQIDVIMGAGHPFFDEDGLPVDHGDFQYVGGKETWGEILHSVPMSDADHDGELDAWSFIDDRAAFQKLMTGDTPKRLLGIAKVHGTLQVNRANASHEQPFQAPFIESVPTLVEMSRAAINVLDNNPAGFFLMIEGGAIDWASHDNHSGRMIEEEIDFNNSVQTVVDWVEANSSWDETLVIVTGDHECGYLTGPNSGENNQPIWNPIQNNGKGKLPGMEWHKDGHTNALIPFFAKGAGSERFHSYAVNEDPHYGKYIDNADIGKQLMLMFTISNAQYSGAN
ncbi:alkaline phosphatase [candidate division KSB1 bacterium]|nr:alkaline phosphatase [candidate division KSB1 bacterium]